MIALACGTPELDHAKRVVEAEEREDSARRELTKLERELARHDVEIAAAKTALGAAKDPAERETMTLKVGRLMTERSALEGSIAAQQGKVRESEIAARKARIESKQ